MEDCDIVIVGGGSAGCVLAERFSADPNRRVLLLEAGPDDRRLWIRVPIGYGISFHDPRVNWRFTAEPDPGLDGKAAYWPRGKVLGGSSSINAMVYHRGLPSDYDDWRDAGNPGWGWEDVAPVYDAIERRVFPDGHAEGDGPLWVSDREPDLHPLRRHLLSAAEELGLPVAEAGHGAAVEGVCRYAMTIRKGLRCSASDAFLRPAMRRPNLRVVTGALATRVLFEGPRAVGVAFRREGGGTERVRAAEKVVLAAAPSARPSCSSFPASAPDRCCGRWGSRRAATCLRWAAGCRTMWAATGCDGRPSRRSTPRSAPGPGASARRCASRCRAQGR